MIESTELTPQSKLAPVAMRPGLTMNKQFAGVSDPFAEIDWERRTAEIVGENKEVIFRQENVEVPKSWSMMATNVVVQKYFRGTLNTPQRETSVRQIIDRVARTIADWGKDAGYFTPGPSAENFYLDLKYLLVNQHMAFNSPVWFNVGVEEHPQCSACFINSVDDTMESILQLAKTEGMLFKYGSGTGTNFSSLRSSKELLNGGGTSSGPISFMKGFDAFAGVIKSGGRTRRAAKMVILNADHPDIVEFVNCKVKEEKKAHVLIDAGYDGSFTGEAYGSVFFQNSNNSIRVTNDFMHAVKVGLPWKTVAVTTGKTVETLQAKDIWDQIADAAWQCGDPGLQFDTTINDWHTSISSGRINSSNPCAEYMFLDDSACNLASLNLMKFVDENGNFDVIKFQRAVDITILAQEILVGSARYPTEKITENSKRFRPLGLGYANLGALLMSRGLPYDSDAGRSFAGAITALMHGRANLMSACISQSATGPFDAYEENKSSFIAVMHKHKDALYGIDGGHVPADLSESVKAVWDLVIKNGKEHGFRNAQVTVLAPTGTIGFLMDCDTTGIEPDIALVKYKRLVGGGMLKIVNGTVFKALKTLGYTDLQRLDILDWIERNDTIEGAPYLQAHHLPVFDCAFRPRNGARSIHHMGHIKMMAATQPFLSGAISKTVNLPSDCTVEDIKSAYMRAWELGLKAIAVYRDGCKRSQPVSTSSKSNADGTVGGKEDKPAEAVTIRRKLPDERPAITHRFSIAGHDGYFTVGMYDDGQPGELFIRTAKEGSTVSGLMDSFAVAVSIAFQHGVPLKCLVDKFKNTRFDPSGWTQNQDIQRASSLMDYIFRWMELKFIKPEEGESKPEIKTESVNGSNGAGSKATWKTETDAPMCPSCGAITVRNGSCHKCLNCGESLGCS